MKHIGNSFIYINSSEKMCNCLCVQAETLERKLFKKTYGENFLCEQSYTSIIFYSCRLMHVGSIKYMY